VPPNGTRPNGTRANGNPTNGTRANAIAPNGARPDAQRSAGPAPATARAPEATANPLDSAANATAARLIAEGRARMATQPDEDDEQQPGQRPSRRDRRDSRFDLASLAALPAELNERFELYSARRQARLAAYTPRQRLWHRLRLAGLAGLGVFVMLPVLMFFLGYLFFSIPDPDVAVNNQVATIKFADGSSLAKIAPSGVNRIKVTANQIPPVVQYAVLSAEDRTFFSNPGFDFTGIARAAFKQLTGGQGGGSTITQQYVKQTMVGDEHSYWRKYKEMIISVKISRQMDKQDILCDYLNAIYFGRGTYGIEAASQAYFKTDVWQLNAAQGALLAGLIQSPSRWDPAIDRRHAVERWNYVMDGMVRMGWLSQHDRDAAQFPATQPPGKATGGTPGDYRGLILTAVRDELERRGITEQEFNQEGLTVTTTIDPEAQNAAVEAAHKGLSGQPDNLRSAVVSINPTNGAILAYYGGDNGVGLDYATVKKQPGSTFKPFVLLADLLLPDPKGLGAKFKGEPLPGLRNADGASCALCDLKQAMTISNNVIYHQLGLEVGPPNVAAAAAMAGITSPMKNPDPGIALGDKEVTPYELASAYATIADGGVYHEPHLVAKVTTADDRVLYAAVDGGGQQRFSEKVARNVIEAMLGVPTYDKLTLPAGRAVAAKTGTVQSYIENQNNDAWTAGFTPQVAAVVWIGTDQNTPIKNAKGRPINGGDLPASIWKSYMYDYTKPLEPESFGPFKPIGTPPTVQGVNDGFMAGGSPPTSTTTTTPGSTPEQPNGSTPAPDEAPPNSGRVCDDRGCHDVGDSQNQTQGSDERRDSGDDGDSDSGDDGG
ncbi:MAG TPA: transglycosylase domain-containing protein, partial [Pseudonocardia sp.]|jgi:membrane peptidoglycan carboxypeptidase